jgi:hypothetical protein
MFTEDLDVFFNTSEFALDATLGAATIQVIFDNEHRMAHDMVSTTNPVALAKAADVDSGDVGSTITISGTAYTIRDVQSQDDGSVVLLQLERA